MKHEILLVHTITPLTIFTIINAAAVVAVMTVSIRATLAVYAASIVVVVVIIIIKTAISIEAKSTTTLVGLVVIGTKTILVAAALNGQVELALGCDVERRHERCRELIATYILIVVLVAHHLGGGEDNFTSDFLPYSSLSTSLQIQHHHADFA